MNVVIFDFDGTIADSFETLLAIVDRLVQEMGLDPITPEEVRRFQNLTATEALRQSRLPLLKLPSLLRRLKAEMNQHICQLKPIPGIPEALSALHDRGDRLGIVTSNSQENVDAFLKLHNLLHLFEFVNTESPLFGKSRALQRVLRRYHLAPETVLYVGDETRDIEAARKTKIRIISVSWGFNFSQILAAQNPDFLVHKPEDLVTVIHGQG